MEKGRGREQYAEGGKDDDGTYGFLREDTDMVMRIFLEWNLKSWISFHMRGQERQVDFGTESLQQ